MRDDGNIIIGTTVDLGGINSGLNSIQNAFKRLSKQVRGAIGVTAFAALGKSAVELASNLEEVQNIVDVTFGKMSYKIEGFVKSSVEQFGISELAAKQTAGSFMAMGKSIGLSAKNASNMSIRLTGLTGDFASFYNISQEYAKTALSAVYTGETETLKRYGIVLTEANLQQYANTHGIDANVKAMDARSKAMLRYNYIVEATKFVQGDFANTQNSWANQTRVLTENWKVFLTVIGNGLKTVLVPLVRVLNSIIQALTTFAKKIGIILSNIFGIKFESTTSKAAQGYDDVASGADDAAEATDKLAGATKKATKEAKKALAPFDTLNILHTNQDDGSGSGNGKGKGGVESPEFPDIELLDMGPSLFDKMIEKISSSIDTLYGLGVYLGDVLTGMLNNIPWESIYEGAKNFGIGLADFLNGLISPELFGAVGRTIAGSLNTAIYSALSFAERFDWKDFGNSLASGISNFFQTFDFGAFADTIDAWVQGIYDFITTAISKISWKDVLKGITEFISRLDLKTINIIIGTIMLKKIGSLVFGFDFVSWFAKSITPKLTEAFQLAIGKAGTLKEAMETMFSPLQAKLMGVGLLIGGIVMGISNFFTMLEDGFSWVNEAFMLIGIALATIGAIILGVPATVAAVVAAIVAAVATAIVLIVQYWDEIKQFFADVCNAIADFFKGLWDGIASLWGTVSSWFNNYVIKPIFSFFKFLYNGVLKFFKDLWEGIKSVWNGVATWFNDKVIKPLVEFFKSMWTNVKQLFSDLWEGIKNIWNICSTWFNATVIQPVINLFSNLYNKVKTFFSDLWAGIKNIWSSVCSWFSNTIINPLVDAWQSATGSIGKFFSNLWDGVKSGCKSVINGMIRIINGFIEGVAAGVNFLIDMLNKISFDIPDWVPGIGGKTFGISIGHVNPGTIPYLAKGGVIPPNSPFMAVLGDQKKGTNIEAPLDTIKQALQEVLAQRGDSGGGDMTVVLELDGNEFGRAVVKYGDKENKRVGMVL